MTDHVITCTCGCPGRHCTCGPDHVCGDCDGKLYKDTWVCPSCNGTKVSDTDPFPHCTDCSNEGVIHDEPEPCRTCLVYPADRGVQRDVQALMGYAVWNAVWAWERNNPWFSAPRIEEAEGLSESSCWLALCQVPLWLPGAHDIALRLLWKRHGDGPVTGTALHQTEGGAWFLRGFRDGGWIPVRLLTAADHDALNIPDDTPHHLRLARVLSKALTVESNP